MLSLVELLQREHEVASLARAQLAVVRWHAGLLGAGLCLGVSGHGRGNKRKNAQS